jgi:hypothetical protein
MPKDEEPLAIEFRGLRGYLRAAKYFIQIFAIGYATCYILTRFVNLDFWLINLHLQNLWLIIPEGTTAFFSAWIWNWSRTSEKKKKQKQAKQDLQTLIRQAEGGEKQK